MAPNTTTDNIPLLHRYGLTLLMSTPSHLRAIRDNDDLVQQFLNDCEISPDMIPAYQTAIDNFDTDGALSQQLAQNATLLLQVLGGFYPTPPCPKREDAIDIMKRLS